MKVFSRPALVSEIQNYNLRKGKISDKVGKATDVVLYNRVGKKCLRN